MRDELASQGIEQKVLSYLIEYEQEQPNYIPKLSEDDFHYFGETFRLFQRLYESDQENLDSATIYTRGDESRISDILRTSVSPSEIDSLYENLKDLSNRRKLLYFTKLVDGAIQSDEAIKGRIVDLEEKFVDLTEGFYSSDSLKPTEELVSTVKEHLDQLRESEGLTGIPTGLTVLDSKTAGWQDGDYILLAARTSIGKTDFMLNSALEAAQNNYKVGIFSLEMKDENLLKRMTAQLSEVDRQKIRRGLYNDQEEKRIKSALSSLEDMPIYLDDQSNKIDEISYKIQRQTKQDEMDIAFVDYFGLIGMPTVENGTVQNEKAECSHKLKFLAKKVNIPLIVLAQINRQAEYNKSKAPSLSNLRGTGALEQDADITLILNRPGIYDETDIENTSYTRVDLVKQRNGPIGEMEANYEAKIGRFRDPSVQ